MNTQTFSILAVCLSVALTGFSDVSDAKGRNKSKSRYDKEYMTQLPDYDSKHYDDDHDKDRKHNGKGYPNGRPWKAIEKDLDEIKAQNRRIGKRTKKILYQLDRVENDIDDMQDDVQDIADDVSALTNTLQVQLSVVPATRAEHSANNVIARIFVQVNQNGIGVAGLDPDSFSFSKSFNPRAGSANYCGLRCFTEAGNGAYAIDLMGNNVAGNYAGNLIVEDTGSRAIPTGTSLVTFEIPEPPPGPTPK